MDFANVIPMLCAELNAAGTADLVFWTVDELTRYAELALRALTGSLLLFVDEQDLVGIAGQSAYDLAHTTDDIPVDTHFVSLIHAVWGGAAISPMAVRELEAKDANWQTTAAAAPTNWIGDWIGTGIVLTYPQPTQGAAFSVFCQRCPRAIATGSTALPAPDALADLLHFRALAAARSKRTDAWMPEAAALAGEIAGALEKAFAAYYGSGK